MRILFLSPHPPTPIKRRTLNLLRHLARRHEVHLRVLASPSELRSAAVTESMDLLGAACASVQVLPVSLSLRLAAAARDYTSGSDARSAYMHAHDRWAAPLQRECDQLDIEIVHADRVRLARLAIRVDRPALVDLPDCMSWGMDEWAAAARGPRAAVYRSEARRLRALEGGALNSIPVITVASPDDGERVRAAGYRGTPFYLPGIIDFLEEPARSPPPGADELHLMFHGTLSYRPNVDAITAFVRDVLPELRARHPGLVLSVVGARPVAAVRALRRSGVRVVADVPQIAPWLRAATAVVVPMRIAVGHSQKVCEALLARRPVICSAQAAARVDADVRAALLVADGPDDWVRHVGGLIDDPARAAALAEMGCEAVRRCYGPDAVVSRLENAYHAALEAWPDENHPGER